MSPSTCCSDNICWKLPLFYRNLSLCSCYLPPCTFRGILLAVTTYLSRSSGLFHLSFFDFVDDSLLPENISLVTLVTAFSEYPYTFKLPSRLSFSYYPFVFWCTLEIDPWIFPVSLGALCGPAQLSSRLKSKALCPPALLHGICFCQVQAHMMSWPRAA